MWDNHTNNLTFNFPLPSIFFYAQNRGTIQNLEHESTDLNINFLPQILVLYFLISTCILIYTIVVKGIENKIYWFGFSNDERYRI